MFNTDYEDYYWLNDDSRKFLAEGYLQDGMTAEERVRQIAETAESYLKMEGFADKFESYMKKGWISLASPVWANYGMGRALPISCNGSYIPDSVEEIMTKVSEIALMTKNGSGTSAYFGDMRPRGAPISAGGNSDGVVRFLELFDKVSNVISQNGVRRGSFAAYLPIDHDDFYEFMDIREHGHIIQKMSLGVCIPNTFMERLNVKQSEERKRWIRLLEKKFSSGYPYLFFSDNSNDAAPKVYKDKGMRIHASNLCNEIHLSSNKDESFVCCLSSLNLLHYDQWKNTDLVQVMTYFLDTVIEEYIIKTKDKMHMQAAHNFAKNQRAIGIGVLGWHSFLQSKMIPFESFEAKTLTSSIFQQIDEQSLEASKHLAKIFGEPPLLTGYGERMVTRIAIAPTTSSSFILGQVSSGIEPLRDNYFVKDLAKGNFSFKNPFLVELLKQKNQNTRLVWKDILANGGSVQHLSILTDHEKDVFKTFSEISPYEIITQAAIRQKRIDQGQSLNLMFGDNIPIKDISDLMRRAHSMKIKGLYYQRGFNASQELSRSIMTCKSCEA